MPTDRGTKPFRFSVQGYSATSAADFRSQVRTAESLGYSAFHLADHYLGPGPALTAAFHPPQDIAAVPAMAMAAEATSHIKIGCRLLCVGYRPAAVLVKEAMTLDFLSGGRLELGLGAGWIESEYHAMGVPYDLPGKRIERLEETVALLRQAMAGGALDVHGKFVRVSGYRSVPLPVQQPVPLMIGGGNPRILKLAAREADIVSINISNRAGRVGPESLRSITHEETIKKVQWVKEGAGPRFDQIELEIGLFFAHITDSAVTFEENYATGLGMTPEQIRRFPHALIGSADHICDELTRRRELYGISYINVPAASMVEFAPIVERMLGK
ncbi:MAG TPA: TIGR03621 family F420-dependent LLM class oxidoreductase [Mycobacterium sp.]